MSRAAGMLLALFFALTAAGCATTSAPSQDQPSIRIVTQLTDGWEFAYNDEWSPSDAIETPASSWQPVSLPHSWNRLGEYCIGRTQATDNRQGRGWYRREIAGTDLDPARRHFIEFDAVGNVADAWLNGQHLGSHSGAFTRFRFELTAGLDFTGSNILLVRADNSDPQPGSSTEHVIPLLGDFFIHGGIYRPARLISVPHSHIDLTDAGGPGVYAVPSLAADGSATIAATVRLDGALAGQEVRLKAIDAEGRTAAETNIALTAGQTEARGSLDLASPRLWNGLEDPYLYRLEATLVVGGRTVDRVVQPLGIRSIRFDPDKGFFLNGEPLRLRGVSRHQDYLGKGWALSEEDNARDMAMIAEMGANSVRVAHYPQAEQWFDLADRYGMVVWAEVPFVNKAAFTDAAASPELVANARQQMTEMIRQNFNHPSVVTWGIGNEVDIDLAFKRLGPKADARPLLRELNALSKREDPSRPTVLADCCEATPGEKADYLPILTGQADLMGYNRYFGWYYGKVEDLGPHLDMLHARHPGVPLSVSEYGAGGALTQHSDHPEGRPTNVTGRPQPEEFQSWLHEQSWPQIRAREYLWGSWIWNMFDFSSRVRQEGDATDINTKGLVSFDRTIRKDAFFYYRAQWSNEPVVHITSRRFVQRTEPGTRIKVYSNAPSVDLSLNGEQIGSAPCIDRICTREGVTLVAGENLVTAKATFGAEVLDDSVSWTLLPQ
ncbi:glycoside hydrolase family 2 protein [Allopontixanthobacter sp.]|uniref:glycoside hydrolase family 2 protein n=1 Tax=Allopontixanthobacter sp. TaxID=2906452 RepID=UPI002AB96B9B|nr:glycoside hydrolase family 2 TIM barrel-domain containing protein [Allopontixanthobacter sp.]MDZ4307514.1 glycoside hydrolase family 2 TIM barrel-domain containing protein [Allopontixanthobacter sp.]